MSDTDPSGVKKYRTVYTRVNPDGKRVYYAPALSKDGTEDITQALEVWRETASIVAENRFPAKAPTWWWIVPAPGAEPFPADLMPPGYEQTETTETQTNQNERKPMIFRVTIAMAPNLVEQQAGKPEVILLPSVEVAAPDANAALAVAVNNADKLVSDQLARSRCIVQALG